MRVTKRLVSLFALSVLILSTVLLGPTGAFIVPQPNNVSSNAQYSPMNLTLPLETRWSTQISAQKPVVDGYTVYASKETSPRIVKAFELASGRAKWEYRFEDKLPPDGMFNDYSFSNPAVKNGVVYVGSMYYMNALRDLGDKAELLWSVPMRLTVYSRPVVTDSAVYVATKGELFALDPATGNKKWSGTADKTVTIAEGKIFASYQNTLRAYVDKGTAKVIAWEKKLGTTGEMTASVYCNGLLYVGQGDTLYALNPGTGKTVWQTKLSSLVENSLAIGQSNIFVNLVDEKIAALDLKTGAIRWQVSQDTEGIATVTKDLLAAGDTLYSAVGYQLNVIDNRTYVRAYNAITGALLGDVSYVDRSDKSVSLIQAKNFLLCATKDTLQALIPKVQNIKINLIGGRVSGIPDSYPRVPVIINGRVLLPMRGIFEEIGAYVAWDEKTKSITATKGDRVIKIAINQTDATVNGRSFALDVPPQLIENTTMVPIRFISESLDMTVEWVEANKQVNIINYREFAGQTLIINGQVQPEKVKIGMSGDYREVTAKPLFDYLGGEAMISITEGLVGQVGDSEIRSVPPSTGSTSIAVGERIITIRKPPTMAVPGSIYEVDRRMIYLDIGFFQQAFGWEFDWDRENNTLSVMTD